MGESSEFKQAGTVEKTSRSVSLKTAAGRLRGMFYLPGNAWILTSTSTLWSVGGAMASPYQSLFYYSIGATPILIGYLAAVTSLITAMAQLIGGYVGDIWGRKKAIIIFSFVGVGNNFIYFMVPNASLLLIPVIVGSVSGIYGPLFTTSLTEAMEPSMRPRGVASYSFINTIPAVLSPYVGGLLIGAYGDAQGIRYAFMISGLLGIIAITYRALRMKENFSARKRVGLSEFFLTLLSETRNAFAVVGRDAKLLLLYSVIASFAVGLTSSFSVLYFVQALHFPPYFYGVVVGVSSLAVMLLLFPAARMVEKIGLKRSVVYSSLSVPLNQLFFTKAKDMDELVTWGVVGGTGTGLLGPPLTSLQSDIVPKFIRGRIMAMFSALPLILSVPAQILGGYLYSISPLLPFVVSIPVFVLSVIVLLSVREPSRLEA
ncbi:MAG: MFS transporter [Thermoplasmata archaeon YP2-bin.285]|uniref:MFS transporter n=1 Tax=Candidatus Sysuiplasma superficiale TaxID=2823368 RepID=A0A8J8CA58_9ARCH|nr:MFS transporter [Candidatus Sysuiplasma superficiale]